MNNVQKAHQIVSQAIKRGELVRSSECELCGSSYRVVGHHYAGYDGEDALRVWWVCDICNQALRGRHDNSLTKEQAIELIFQAKLVRRWVVAIQSNKNPKKWYIHFRGIESQAKKRYDRVTRYGNTMGTALLSPSMEIVESVGDTSTLFE